ncbi:hypothetical protein QAD02_000650 [Eretmocerus hayati]|uniref:Uncharacterized protein n=1 Tax=Eretmocerus hayati TaxID=131215 RepID=A0ACC2NEU0_9HYME|nr:hypothetical protein QAD02_000650 [Eretmocerus hayati]
MTSSQTDGSLAFVMDLIENFRQRPQLYDKKDERYKLSKCKEKAYAEIVTAVNKNQPKGNKITEDVKRRWRNIRKSMTSYLSGKTSRKYYLPDKLGFLVPHLDYKTTVKKEKSDGEDSEEDPSEIETTGPDDGEEIKIEQVLKENTLEQNSRESQSSTAKKSQARNKDPQHFIKEVCEGIYHKNGNGKRKNTEENDKPQGSKMLPPFSKKYVQEKRIFQL